MRGREMSTERSAVSRVATPPFIAYAARASPRKHPWLLLASPAYPSLCPSFLSSRGKRFRCVFTLSAVDALRHFVERLCCRNVPMVAIHSFAPYRSMHRHLLSSAMILRPNHLSCIRSMASNVSAEEAGVPRSVPVAVAHELLKAGHRYLDVRTEGEFSSGHAVGAVNIPYMFKSSSGMSKNPNFMQEVLSTFKKDDEIIVGCLSGKRSSMAATELSNAGFTGITDISGGYSAWVENGLPTEK
ncbi:hypothetical protein C4D60_Mb11t01050 [Musa balbisiana]|uniref:Rhodanese domain-containing protein n=1 Tax=Musa balbisiana TaxID=52838 RepID=A0A4S8J3B6_MUSBA|nr:hypothetical protein C4D60_Mb11t01050 [Musa balbisiana]